ncbi:MAG: tetratricopeptide repeat protein, partial [Zetaproteobacteria bacterium]
KPVNWCGVADGLARAEEAVSEGRLEDAERILQELLEFAPTEFLGWKMLAHVQRDLGKIQEGINSATIALRLKRRRPDGTGEPASLRLAKLLWQQGEHGKALAMLEVLLQQTPDDQELNMLASQWRACATS